jgi:hypothetical protein
MRLELVLAGKGPPANGTGVGPLAGVQQLVTNHVLGTRELLAAHVARELVVRLGLVRLEVLRQLAQFDELFPAFAAGVDGGAAVGVTVAGGDREEGRGGGGEVGMLVGPVAVEPAFAREGEEATLKIKKFIYIFIKSWIIITTGLKLLSSVADPDPGSGAFLT